MRSIKRGFSPIYQDDDGNSRLVQTVNPVENIRRGVEQDKPEPRAVTVCMADVEPVDVDWLWPDRIPLGKQSLVVGNPGLGKSFLALEIVSRVTTGVGWPDNREHRREPADVLILSAEDGKADTIRPRLDAAEANVSRVHLLTGVQHPEDPDGELGHFSFERDLRHLRRILDENRAIRLIVVDPLSAYLGQADSHKDSEIRRTLAPLSALAEQSNVAVLSILHNNKSQSLRAIHRVMGSTAFVANARTAWGVCEDPTDPEGNRMLMLQLKNNLAPNPGGLTFRIVSPGCVHWYDGVTNMTIDEAMAPSKPGRPTSTRDEAEEWIRERLAGGPVLAKDMLIEGEEAFASRTLTRAKQAIGVLSRQLATDESKQKAWHWVLP